MNTPGQQFYGTSTLTRSYTSASVLAGHVIRLSPALITLTDGRIATTSISDLQRDVLTQVDTLSAAGVRSWHVDVNFDDYSGFGARGPDRNAAVFTPEFVAELIALVEPHDGFVTLHLLTDHPAHHLDTYAHLPLGAVCFQLDAVRDPLALADLIARITDQGACASPVIETVGTDTLSPALPEQVCAQLEPHFAQIGMLTLQAAGTATRSNLPAGAFAADSLAAYLAALRPNFSGTIQVQGGLTTATVPAAVRLGAEFLVMGTQLFRHPTGHSPTTVLTLLYAACAAALPPANLLT